ncbi:hypothetical protein CP969_01485 [Streptomyces viridosporus T7A]|uniref:Uncharacterized protein n=1 Tax=Streptomyces viridosporus T7A TaxID=665577 RepID=A0ABX6A747_STRVD|nr:hypothetical protein CP969_01485 [Streptomyces viridosporus T7A]
MQLRAAGRRLRMIWDIRASVQQRRLRPPQDRSPAQARARLAREDVAQAGAVGRVTINEVGQSSAGDQADQDQRHDEQSKQSRPHCPQPNGQMLHLLGNGASP